MRIIDKILLARIQCTIQQWKKTAFTICEKVEMDYWERDHIVDREIMPLIVTFDKDSDDEFLDGNCV